MRGWRRGRSRRRHGGGGCFLGCLGGGGGGVDAGEIAIAIVGVEVGMGVRGDLWLLV